MKNNRSFDAKKVVKKVVAGLVTAGMLTCGVTAFAEYDPNKVIDPNAEYVTTAAGEESGAPVANEVVYNGTTIPAVQVIDIDGHKLFPLREVAEQLGYTVQWSDEQQKIQLIRGAQEIGMYIGQDSYYFSKMMPVELGIAPQLVDDTTTYVPIEFITDIVDAKIYNNEDGSITVVDPAETTLNSVEKGENGNISLNVQDNVIGDVIVHIGEDTKVLVDGVENENFDLSSLQADARIQVGYGAIMTLSLPPQTTAYFVNILPMEVVFEAQPSEDEKSETGDVAAVEFSGSVKAVDIENNQVTIDDNGTERILNIDADTVIKSGNDKRVYKINDLEEGTKISGFRGAAETKSIPPQSYAVLIDIVAE